MTSGHPTFFPGSFSDPSMAFFPPLAYDSDLVGSPMVYSPSYEMQPQESFYHKQQTHYYHDVSMFTSGNEQVQYPVHNASMSGEWQSWSPHTPLDGSDASSSYSGHSHSECSSPQAPMNSNPFSKPPVSWPVECFVTPDPSLSTRNAELLPAIHFSSEMGTPDLLYSTSSSLDDTLNVFDIQFGQSLQPGPIYGYPGDLPSPVSSPSPPSCSQDHSRRSKAHPRTPSPSSDSSPPSSADYRRRFPCLFPGCERRFTSRYTLKVHTEAHKPKPKVTFPCTQGCSERFSRQHDRLRHEVAKHGKICEFSCDECGRFFSTSKTLGNHKCPVAASGTRWVHSTS